MTLERRGWFENGKVAEHWDVIGKKYRSHFH